MRKALTLLFLCSFILLQAQNLKLNYKAEIRPFSFKIEKVKIIDDQAVFFIKVKQHKNFSYSISFEDCYISTASNPEKIKGKLSTWNDDKKIYRNEKTISDEDDEKFTLTFPVPNIINEPKFDIKIGNILDRDKREIIFKDIKTKKK